MKAYPKPGWAASDLLNFVLYTMKLADLKKFSARKRTQVSFSLPNGMECIVDEHGVARVPQLKAVPDFDLEDCIGGVQAFSLRAAGSDRRQSTSRPEMEKLVSSLGGAVPASADHDE